MFTGIVEELGHILTVHDVQGGRALEVGARLVCDDLKIGDSINVNGVCLTVTALTERAFHVEAIAETLCLTNLGFLEPGMAVNLERAMALNGRFGGHWLQGHVDACIEILSVTDEGLGKRLSFALPAQLARYVVKKGYVAIDGTSLTVTNVGATRFAIALIPHTASVTVAGAYQVGSRVNLEVDILGKYVERMLVHELSNK